MSALPPGRGRFAPSPSGPLHLGNVRTALLAWLFARHQGASFVLRNEDLDQAREQPGAAAAMLRDLRWLGLDWDEGPDVGGPYAPYTQSERHQYYVDHLGRLRQAGLVYPCYCSRKDIGQAASAPQGGETALGRYPGTCRDPVRRDRMRKAHPERRPSYRFLANGDTVRVVDRLLGPMERTLAPGSDDFVVWRADDIPAYQLAVVVDDAMMRIGEVVRGADLLDSTPWQVALYSAFGYPIPVFAHVPLLRDADGKRMAKREGSTGVAAVQAEGVAPEEVVGRLAVSCGLIPEDTACTLVELLAVFSPERIDRDAEPESQG